MSWNTWLFLMLATASASATENPQTLASPLRVALDNYCPYYCKAHTPGENRLAEKPGFLIEIMQHAFGKSPDNISYHFVPYNRALREVSRGTVDAIVVTTREEAPELIYPSIEQGRSVGCFYKKNTNAWAYAGLESLKRVRMILIQDYLYGEPLNSYAAQADADQVSFIAGHESLPRILKMINLGRRDVTADDANVVAHALKQTGLEQNIVNAGCYSGTLDFYVGFSPKNPNSAAYAHRLSQTMHDLRSSGELARILARYGATDWR